MNRFGPSRCLRRLLVLKMYRETQTTIKIDFWEGMHALGVIQTGKHVRTHLLTGSLLFTFGTITTILSPLSHRILIVSLPVSGALIITFCVYCAVMRNIKLNFIVSICTSVVREMIKSTIIKAVSSAWSLSFKSYLSCGIVAPVWTTD